MSIDEQVEANRRREQMEAAAPELYKALRAIVDSLHPHSDAFAWINDKATVEAFATARRALAKVDP